MFLIYCCVCCILACLAGAIGQCFLVMSVQFVLGLLEYMYVCCMIEGWCSMRVLTVQKERCLSYRSQC